MSLLRSLALEGRVDALRTLLARTQPEVVVAESCDRAAVIGADVTEVPFAVIGVGVVMPPREGAGGAGLRAANRVRVARGLAVDETDAPASRPASTGPAPRRTAPRSRVRKKRPTCSSRSCKVWTASTQ